MADRHIQVASNAGTLIQCPIDTVPDTCPICHKSGVQIPVTQGYAKGKNGFRAVYRCPVLACSNVYFASYLFDGARGVFARAEPGGIEPYDVSERIKAVAPDFERIVTQAHTADHDGLDLIAGPGYRKALEFLVKEYLINAKFKDDPTEQERVRTRALAQCIKMIDSVSVQRLAERCTWLGNDETHFEAKFPEYDINDMKTLLRLTVREIDNELEAAEYLGMESRAKP